MSQGHSQLPQKLTSVLVARGGKPRSGGCAGPSRQALRTLCLITNAEATGVTSLPHSQRSAITPFSRRLACISQPCVKASAMSGAVRRRNVLYK